MTQTTPGIFGATTDTVASGTVEIVAAGGTVRNVAVSLYPGFGGFDDTLSFELICDSFAFSDLDTGLACVAGEATIVFSRAATTTDYDVADDSSFTIIFNEDGGSCGGNTDVVLEFTKN
jgi:hypothetical protein